MPLRIVPCHSMSSQTSLRRKIRLLVLRCLSVSYPVFHIMPYLSISCHFSPNCVMPLHAVPCLSMLRHAFPYLPMSCLAFPCPLTPFHLVSCLSMFFNTFLYPVMPSHAVPCRVMHSHVRSRLPISCHVFPYRAMPVHVLPSFQCRCMPLYTVLCSFMSCHSFTCRAILSVLCHDFQCRRIPLNVLSCLSMSCYALINPLYHARFSLIPPLRLPSRIRRPRPCTHKISFCTRMHARFLLHVCVTRAFVNLTRANTRFLSHVLVSLAH